MKKKKASGGKGTEAWEPAPGLLAVCRNVAATDLVAAVFLYRVVGLWIWRKKKKERFGKEWLYMSRAAWARTAGLTESELKNRALPKLKSHCAEFLEIRSMKATPDAKKTLWVSLDWEMLCRAIKPWDMYELELNKMGIGFGDKAGTYPYKKKFEDR